MTLFRSSTRATLAWMGTSVSSKAMIMTLSPISHMCAAAPFRAMMPVPRSPGRVYVSKRLPLSTSSTRTFSPTQIPTLSRRSWSTVMLPS